MRFPHSYCHNTTHTGGTLWLERTHELIACGEKHPCVSADSKVQQSPFELFLGVVSQFDLDGLRKILKAGSHEQMRKIVGESAATNLAKASTTMQSRSEQQPDEDNKHSQRASESPLIQFMPDVHTRVLHLKRSADGELFIKLSGFSYGNLYSSDHNDRVFLVADSLGQSSIGAKVDEAKSEELMSCFRNLDACPEDACEAYVYGPQVAVVLAHVEWDDFLPNYLPNDMQEYQFVGAKFKVLEGGDLKKLGCGIANAVGNHIQHLNGIVESQDAIDPRDERFTNSWGDDHVSRLSLDGHEHVYGTNVDEHGSEDPDDARRARETKEELEQLNEMYYEHLARKAMVSMHGELAAHSDAPEADIVPQAQASLSHASTYQPDDHPEPTTQAQPAPTAYETKLDVSTQGTATPESSRDVLVSVHKAVQASATNTALSPLKKAAALVQPSHFASESHGKSAQPYDHSSSPRRAAAISTSSPLHAQAADPTSRPQAHKREATHELDAGDEVQSEPSSSRPVKSQKVAHGDFAGLLRGLPSVTEDLSSAPAPAPLIVGPGSTSNASVAQDDVSDGFRRGSNLSVSSSSGQNSHDLYQGTLLQQQKGASQPQSQAHANPIIRPQPPTSKSTHKAKKAKVPWTVADIVANVRWGTPQKLQNDPLKGFIDAYCPGFCRSGPKDELLKTVLNSPMVSTALYNAGLEIPRKYQVQSSQQPPQPVAQPSYVPQTRQQAVPTHQSRLHKDPATMNRGYIAAQQNQNFGRLSSMQQPYGGIMHTMDNAQPPPFHNGMFTKSLQPLNHPATASTSANSPMRVGDEEDEPLEHGSKITDPVRGSSTNGTNVSGSFARPRLQPPMSAVNNNIPKSNASGINKARYTKMNVGSQAQSMVRTAQVARALGADRRGFNNQNSMPSDGAAIHANPDGVT